MIHRTATAAKTRPTNGPLSALLERFAVRADIAPGASDAVRRQISAYFSLHPVAPDLIDAFERRFRSDLLAQDPEVLKEALAQLGGHPAGYVLTTSPPEDSQPGGPFGYFAAQAKFNRR